MNLNHISMLSSTVLLHLHVLFLGIMEYAIVCQGIAERSNPSDEYFEL